MSLLEAVCLQRAEELIRRLAALANIAPFEVRLVETQSELGACSDDAGRIVISISPLAFRDDLTLKTTIAHEFIHAVYAQYGTEEAAQILSRLVQQALTLLKGGCLEDVEGEYWSEEHIAWWFEGIIAALLYPAMEWHNLFSQLLGGSAHGSTTLSRED